MIENVLDYEKWNTQVYSVNYVDFINGKDDLNNGIYSIKIDNFNLDVLVQDINNVLSDYCLVVFSGALTSEKGSPPFFSGINLAKQLNVPLITISDPSLVMGEDLKLGWYAGNYLKNKLPQKISEILDSIFLRINYKPIIMGGSGGGFASLLQLNFLKTDVSVLIWNPQTNIARYHVDAVLKYLSVCFPFLKKDLEKVLVQSEVDQIKNIEGLLKKIGITYDVTSLQIGTNSKLFYLQNISDIHHVEHHFKNFYHKQGEWLKCSRASFSNLRNMHLYMGSWGEGHIAPPVDMIKDILSSIMLGVEYNDICSEIYKYNNKDYNISIFNKDVSNRCLNCNIFKFNDISKLEVTLDVQDVSSVEYAVYFIRDKERVKINWYQRSNIFDLPEMDFDEVHVFAKDFFGTKVQKIFPIFYKNEGEIFYDKNKSIGFNIINNNTWHTPRFGSVLLGPKVGIDWESDPFQNRSWVWLLQQLHFIKDLLVYDDINHTLDGLKFSDYVIKNWYEVFKNHLFDSPMVWHDHGSALRLRRIIEVKNKLIENNLWDDVNKKLYQELIELHSKYLVSEKYYSKGTNHGLEQTITLLIAVATNINETWSNGYLDICKERLIYEITKMFDKDGGHFENSPHYHALGINQLIMINNILRKYDSILPAASIVSSDFIEKVTSILIFMVSPLGKLVTIGDTEEVVPYEVFKKHNQPKNYALYDYAITCGKSGIKPNQKYVFLPETGWVFYRPQWNDEKDFYLAAKCGFKSNYHRHDDDTSFILFYKGQEWFTDSGLYNYHEADANRKFIRSHLAHSLSYPKGIIPVRNLKYYKGTSQVALIESSKRWFSFEMQTDIFENFNCKRSISIDNTFNFSIEDSVFSNLINHRYYESRFIIPADKEINVKDQYVDIIGKDITLRLFFNLCVKRVYVEDIKVSKVFNQLTNAQALVFEFERDFLNVKYTFMWLSH